MRRVPPVDQNITVRIPPEVPVLTTEAGRVLLAILVGLTHIEVLDDRSGALE